MLFSVCFALCLCMSMGAPVKNEGNVCVSGACSYDDQASNILQFVKGLQYDMRKNSTFLETNVESYDGDNECQSFQEEEDGQTVEKCSFRIETDFNENRIPQLLQRVTCSSEEREQLFQRTSMIQGWTRCEEVYYKYPVLLKKLDTGRGALYHTVLEMQPVACVRAKEPSGIKVKPLHSLIDKGSE